MSLFLSLFFKVLPLYAIIGIGFVAGRFVGVSYRSIADFTIYFISPVVLFCLIWQAELSNSEAWLLPIFTIAMMLVMASTSFLYGTFIWGDSHRNLFSGQLMNGNTGYFGLPVAFALFPEEVANLWILVMLTSTILQVSLGYFIFATGRMSPIGGLRRLLKLPPFYAMIGGLVINIAGVPWPADALNETYQMFRGSFFVLGMSIIGLSLATLSRKEIDWRYIGHSSLWRFLVWPALAIGVITLDSQIMGLIDPQYYGLILLIGILPLAADSAAFAAQLDVFPEKAASAILVTTLIALIYIPTMMVWFAP